MLIVLTTSDENGESKGRWDDETINKPFVDFVTTSVRKKHGNGWQREQQRT